MGTVEATVCCLFASQSAFVCRSRCSCWPRLCECVCVCFAMHVIIGTTYICEHVCAFFFVLLFVIAISVSSVQDAWVEGGGCSCCFSASSPAINVNGKKSQ